MIFHQFLIQWHSQRQKLVTNFGQMRKGVKISQNINKKVNKFKEKKAKKVNFRQFSCQFPIQLTSQNPKLVTKFDLMRK